MRRNRPKMRDDAPVALRPPERVRLYYRWCRWWSRLFFRVFFRGRTYGLEHAPATGGVLVASNHQSFLDPVLAALALPREAHFMGRDSLFRNGAFRRLIESLNCFPIRRGTADLRAIKETLRRLKAGHVVVTFPEGTRTESGAVGPMLAGVILIARKAGVPILPTAICGAFEAWPRDRKLPKRHRVVVAYGPPLAPEEMKRMSDEACVAEVRARILALFERHQPEVGKLPPRIAVDGAGVVEAPATSGEV